MNLIIGIHKKWANTTELPCEKVEDENCLLWEFLPHTKGTYGQKDLNITALLVDQWYLRIIKTPFVHKYMEYLMKSEKELLDRLAS